MAEDPRRTHEGIEPSFESVDETQLHKGYVIDLCQVRFRAPDGTVISREVVRHPGAVSIVPLWDNGDVVLVSQFRAPLGRYMIEIPAGKRDVQDEPPQECARRELEEEVGLSAGSLEQLVVFHNSVGFSDEESFAFLATDLTEIGAKVQGVEETFMSQIRVPLSEALDMIARKEITDAKTILGLTFAAARRGV